MHLKYFFIMFLVSSNTLIAESYFDNLTIKNNDENLISYKVEVIRSPEKQRLGLMFRKELTKKTGILFVFKEEKKASFWMKNTLIPLDIIFISKDGKIDFIKINAKPGSLKRIRSKNKIIAVLEINSGESYALGINQNSRVEIQKFLDSL
ncbi:MAG TPA: DUF192 domain-containing protein [Gammaproteobacteria bacterium]|nr:DUF192 domain-containing protein [Gammaproteobacteria bacterium]